METASLTLLSPTLPTVLSSVSSLAPSSPIATGGRVPTTLPPALDHHVFHPLIDLSFENFTNSFGATTVTDPDDLDSEKCATYTVIYLPDDAINACVRMTGE